MDSRPISDNLKVFYENKAEIMGNSKNRLDSVALYYDFKKRLSFNNREFDYLFLFFMEISILYKQTQKIELCRFKMIYNLGREYIKTTNGKLSNFKFNFEDSPKYLLFFISYKKGKFSQYYVKNQEFIGEIIEMMKAYGVDNII